MGRLPEQQYNEGMDELLQLAKISGCNRLPAERRVKSNTLFEVRATAEYGEISGIFLFTGIRLRSFGIFGCARVYDTGMR